MLAKHYRPGDSGTHGPSWLTFIGHVKDSLWSVDLFRRESILLRSGIGATLDVIDYAEHAMGQGSEAMAVAYVETTCAERGVLWGVGTDPSTITASLRAVLNAYERAQQEQH